MSLCLSHLPWQQKSQGAHPDVRKEIQGHTQSRNLIMTSPSQGRGPCPHCVHASTPCGCQHHYPNPPPRSPMPPEHQQERLTLEINMCCWNVFRYHCGNVSLQAEDLSWQAGPEVLSKDCVSGVNARMVGEEQDRGLTLLKIISQFS